jgi:uroporphyrinogen-III synthase
MALKKSSEKAKTAKKPVKKSPKSATALLLEAPAPRKSPSAAIKNGSSKTNSGVARLNGGVSLQAANGAGSKSQPVAGETEKKSRKPSKKSVVTLPAPPKVEISNYPKNKVRSILVSQPKPSETEKNPYFELAKKHNISVNFRQFIRVEGLTSQEFRAQRIDILEHGAVILTSKLAVDHYFRICNEMRITVPETMKYFCINEQTAYYLQKYIQYRKRKIFFGHGTIVDLVDVIKKNKAEKFLLPASDAHKEQIVDFLEEVRITFTKAVFYKTVSADLSDLKSLAEYDVLVFFTPVGLQSLKKNFPNFKQGPTRIAAFGHISAQMVKSLGYRLDIFAPDPQNPSMTAALDSYIKEANKR